MKTTAFILTLLCVSSAWAAKPQGPDVSPHFTNFDGCFILYDLKKDKQTLIYNRKVCHTRLPACSTFKIPLALMAFDSGVLKDPTTTIAWDKTPYTIESWNHDQTAESWMKNSVVWFSQRLTPTIGAPKIQRYLDRFDYGSKDISGGLTTAWLTMAPFLPSPPKTTLKITPAEQVRFLTKLWKGQLKVSADALTYTKQITFLETSPRGYALSGKTGSGVVEEKKQRLRVGWFVSEIEKEGEAYIAVVAIKDKKQLENTEFAGREAKKILQDILTELSLY